MHSFYFLLSLSWFLDWFIYKESVLSFFFFKIFIYLFCERDRVRESTRGEVRGRSRLPMEPGAWCGTRSKDFGIMTWAEGSCRTNWATQAPLNLFFILKISLWERVGERAWVGRQQREKQTPHGAGSLMWDSIQGLRDRDLGWRQLPNQLSHPGAPIIQCSFWWLYISRSFLCSSIL